MKNLRLLVGMPVICGGRKLGRVVQAQVSEELTCMTGLFVDAGIKGTRFIPSSDVSVLGDVAVLVRSEGRRGARAQCGYPRRALTPDGKHLGAICGAGVNEESLNVEALELSIGWLEDVLTGRRRVRRFTVNEPGGEVVVIEMDGEELGMKGLITGRVVGASQRRWRWHDEPANEKENWQYGHPGQQRGSG